MPDTTTAIVGNLTDDPELRHTESGIARAMFRGGGVEGAGAGGVIVWRDQGDAQLRPVASSTMRCGERDQERHGEVPLLVAALVRFVARSSSTNSRPSSAGTER